MHGVFRLLFWSSALILNKQVNLRVDIFLDRINFVFDHLPMIKTDGVEGFVIIILLDVVSHQFVI